MPKDPNEIGALWIKQSSKGEYMTGTIDGKKVVVFRNNKKTASKFISAEETKILADASKAESVVVSAVKTKI